MEDQGLLRGSSIVSSLYIKRWMEKNYDRLMMTGPGKRLMDLDQKTRYGIEFLLYVVTAVGEQTVLQGNSPVQLLIR
ncbi:MAG: hypothetical protein HYV60_00055 [Planctomycetia bacterium]|nr:hypothetical protein [Planctomycetia bacterium]